MVQWTLMFYHNTIGRGFEAQKPKPQKSIKLKKHIFGLLLMSSFPPFNMFSFISYAGFTYSHFFSSNVYTDFELYYIRKLQIDPSNR